MTSGYSRRGLLGLFAMVGGVILTGCERKTAVAGSDQSDRSGTAPHRGDARAMLVYRDPECGCCEAWAEIAREAGYRVTIENRTNMAEVKARHGVPVPLASCHTAIIAGYAIEGHVPMRHVAKLLGDRPRDIQGLAVPGMPRGSPGMEMPDGSIDAYEVMAFDAMGKYSVFQA